MKILVIGDTHGNIVNIKHVMGFAKAINVKAVIHTGDWNNIQSIDSVVESKISLYAVLGNADIDPTVFKKLKKVSTKFSESLLQIKIAGIKIGVVHKLKVIDYGLLKDLDIVFTGHYHSQKEWEIDGVKIIRPGALENKVSFAIFDTVTRNVEFIDE